MGRTPTGRRLWRGALTSALAALLVVPLVPSTSAAEDGEVRIRPTISGNTAVHFSQSVTVSGPAPSGTVTAARLLGLLADGTLAGSQRIHPSDLNTSPDPLRGGDYLRVQDGQFDGRLTLFCLFGPPSSTCTDRTVGGTDEVRDVVLQVVAGGVTLDSEPLRVDFTRPRIRDAQLVAPDAVVVRMTEPVRYPPLQPELPGDWEVEVEGREVPVTRVLGPTEDDCVGGYGPGEDPRAGRTGCTRTLVLDVEPGGLDEDATPLVDYVLLDDRVPTRTAYEDFASNRLFHLGTGPRLAVDRIRPPTPRIERLAGRVPSDDRVDAAAGAPEAELSNLREGHRAFARITTPEGQVTQTSPVTASGPTVTLALPDLGPDGEYLVEAVVQDPAGNLSTDSTQTKRADQGPSSVAYGLDRIAPRLLSASVRAENVDVLISEPVTGPDRAADWRVSGAGDPEVVVQDVSGTAAVRTLTTSRSVPDGAVVSYGPAPDSGRYADRAGNVVVNTDLVANGVPVPLVLTPSAELYTRGTVATVAGTARPGTSVEVYRDDDGNGTPDGEPVSGPVDGDGRFAIDVALREQQRNDFLARSVQGTAASDFAQVPPVVQDAVAPTLELLSPSAGDVLAGGSRITVRTRACDAFPSASGLEVLFSAGAGFSSLATVPLLASCDEETEIGVELPDQDTSEAEVLVRATDLAKNSSEDRSGLFVVDATAPVFSALTRSAREVLITFREPVSGPVRGADWLVKGSRATLVAVEDGSAAPAATAEQAQRFLVTTSTPAPEIGPNERPEIVYDPQLSGAPAPLGGQLTDRAGQPVEVRAVEAVDGIVPVPPSIRVPGSTVYQAGDRQEYGGTAEGQTTLRLVDEDGETRAPAVRVGDDQAWNLVARLERDTNNRLSAFVVDDAGNTSPLTRGPDVVQDSVAPAVAIDTPRPRQSFPTDSDVEVRWRSSDRNLARDSVVVDVTTDGGRTWQVLGEDQPGTGSLTWRTPSEPTSRAGIRVRALDLAGRTGTATVGHLGVGTAADEAPFAPSEEPLQPVPATRGLDDAAGPPVLGRVLGMLPRTGTHLLYLLFSGTVTVLVGAGLVVAARDQRRLRRRSPA